MDDRDARNSAFFEHLKQLMAKSEWKFIFDPVVDIFREAPFFLVSEHDIICIYNPSDNFLLFNEEILTMFKFDFWVHDEATQLINKMTTPLHFGGTFNCKKNTDGSYYATKKYLGLLV